MSMSATMPRNGADGITTLIRHGFPPLLGFVPPLTKDELADAADLFAAYVPQGGDEAVFKEGLRQDNIVFQQGWSDGAEDVG